MQTTEQQSQEQAKQQKESQEEVQAAMTKMLQEVKKKMKVESKNELIRIIGALLLDNYALKIHLADLQSKTGAEGAKKEVTGE